MHVLCVSNPALAAKSNKPLLEVRNSSFCILRESGRNGQDDWYTFDGRRLRGLEDWRSVTKETAM